MRVLYVEDNPLDAELASATWKEAAPDIQIEVASSCAAAFERLRPGVPAPDVVLSDMRLPDGDGLQLLSEVRAQGWPIAFVLLTGQGDEGTAVAALRAGADGYHIKEGGYLERLPSVLREACERHRREAARYQQSFSVLFVAVQPANETELSAALAQRVPPVMVETLASPSEAQRRLDMALAEGEPFGVLLVEHAPPTLDALALLERIRVGAHSEIPVVVLATEGGESVVMQALRLGATDYLARDSSCAQQLPGVIESAFNRSQLRREKLAHRASEERLRTLALVAPVGIIRTDRSGRCLFVNEKWCSLSGLSPAQAAGPGWIQSIHPDERERVTAEWMSALSRGEGFRAEFRLLTADGVVSWVLGEGRPERDSAGAIAGYVGTLTDITELRLAEDALRRAEEKYRHIVENASEGVFQTTPDGHLITANRALARFLGYESLEALLADAGQAIIQTYADPEGREAFKRLMDLHGQVRGLEHRLRRRDGSCIWVSENARAVSDDQGRLLYYEGTLVDITARRRAEEERASLEIQLRQSQKMEAIGQLAGGVAHDFNNILTVIQCQAETLLEVPNLEPETRDAAQQVLQASQRAANLTRQLLAFGRKQVLQPRAVDLNEVVAQMSRMLKRVLGERTKLEAAPAADLAGMRGDVNMIEQVLLNLAVNARDAMPEGGLLRVATRNVLVGEEQARQNPDAYAGRFVSLEVTDTGQGILPEVIGRIFEPFFTTKAVGQGTGLGLATAFGIVKQHGGWIEVASQPGQGATFRIYFPATDDRPAPKTRTARPPTQLRGNETVLVVEDEEAVRRMIETVLHRNGYAVLAAASGVEARSLWEACKENVDLLLTDLVMPDGVSGWQLAQQLLDDRPELPVVYMSGYSADAADGQIDLTEGVNFLQKPYTPTRLLQVVRDRLQDTRGIAPP